MRASADDISAQRQIEGSVYRVRGTAQPASGLRLRWRLRRVVAALLRGDLALGACSGENPSLIATKQRSLSSDWQRQVEVGPCHTLSMLDLPRFATPPGKQRIALVSRSPESGGDCGASGMRVRW
jgi:hypothetical protein